MSPGLCSAGPPLLPFPLHLCSASQALLFLTHTRDILDSGPLALLFPLPGMFFTWITMWWASPYPPLGHSLSVTFSVRPALIPFLLIATNPFSLLPRTPQYLFFSTFLVTVEHIPYVSYLPCLLFNIYSP